MEKLKISYPVIVEGKYDKIKLLSVIDADIFITSGFGIFKNTELCVLFRALAQKSPIIILTDSDGAGTLIRSRFASIIPSERLINLYIPQIQGKERRKSVPSKEGTLGVEGMDTELLYKLFEPFAGDTILSRGGITKTDLYTLGLSGGKNSSLARARLARQLGFPEDISANALLSALNILYDRESFLKITDSPKGN